MLEVLETKSFELENPEFLQIVGRFFRINPANPYWLLLAFYFAKNRRLDICKEFDSNKDCVLLDISLRRVSIDGTRKTSVNYVIAHNVSERERNIIDSINEGHYRWYSVNDHELALGYPSMNPLYIPEIVSGLNSLSDIWYAEHSSEAFHFILDRIQNRITDCTDFVQPLEITKLVVSLLDAKNGSVYNPFAGVCSYGEYLDADVKYLGQEISSIHAVGELNLLLNSKDKASCIQGDSFKDWKDDFDYIVTTPPFGLVHHSKDISQQGFVNSEHYVLNSSSFGCRKKSVGVYSESICFDKRPSQICIENIIDRDYIETVILLPTNLFDSTGISTVIIVTNKDKKLKKRIRFVDASSCYIQNGRKNILNYEEVLTLANSTESSDKVAIVSNYDVCKNKYRLTPRFYIKPEELTAPEGFKTICLSEVLTRIRPKRLDKNLTKKFSFNLKLYGEHDTPVINAEKLEWAEVFNTNYKHITEDCLVTTGWGKFKSVYLKTCGETVSLLAPINRAFRVNSDIVDPIYLVGEFSKDYFVKQLSRFGSGLDASNLKLSIEDFLGLKIFIPLSLEEQKALALELREQKFEESIKLLVKEHSSKMEEFVLNQRQRKHAVAQVLNEILPAVENVESFILNNESVTKDSVVSRRFGTTFEEYIKTIKVQVEKVVSLVDCFTKQETFGEEEEIDLIRFLKEYCESKKINESYNAVFIHNAEDGEVEQIVKISKKDLTQMLDNLFTNAVKHGFTDEIRKDYIIRVETKAIHDIDEPVVIHVSNNGTPASKSISLDKMFVWGVGNGTGIGCWQVKEIAEHFGGRVDYKEYLEDPNGFVCEFRIVLPLYAD